MISERGRDLLNLRDVPEIGLKERHLEQIAILKLLYSYEKDTVRVKKLLIKGVFSGHQGQHHRMEGDF